MATRPVMAVMIPAAAVRRPGSVWACRRPRAAFAIRVSRRGSRSRRRPVASTSACLGRRRSRLARRAQLELDVVGIAEDQNQDPERLTEVTHLAVWDAAGVEQTHSVLEHLAGRHRKAHMVEPYAIL